MEKEKLELKQTINELEEVIIPRPLFPKPLNTIQLTLTLEDIPESIYQ
jgi:hypothetical protein